MLNQRLFLVWAATLGALLLLSAPALGQDALPSSTPELMDRVPSTPALSPTSTPAPMEPQQSNERQAGDIKTLDLGGEVTMNLVWVPAGTFIMGSPDSEEGRSDDEGPQTRVTLTEGFWMGETEVTNAQYNAFLRDSGYDGSAEADADYPKHLRGQSNMPTGDNYPIVWASWNNAQAFCRWATRKTGYQISLPTEAQWEYACRAGSSTSYSFGSDPSRLGDYAWFDDNSNSQTHPVRQKQPNAWGLYDMHGNVCEWCADWYGTYPGGSNENYLGFSDDSFRVFRGGSWVYDPSVLRSAYRNRFTPSLAGAGLGFRVAAAPRP